MTFAEDHGHGVDTAAVNRGNSTPPASPASDKSFENGAAAAQAPQSLHIRAALTWFAVRMERKLQRNDHKPPWSTEAGALLLAGLLRETADLITTSDPAVAIDECVDVAIFAMMIAHNIAGNPGGCDRGVRPENLGTDGGD